MDEDQRSTHNRRVWSLHRLWERLTRRAKASAPFAAPGALSTLWVWPDEVGRITIELVGAGDRFALQLDPRLAWASDPDRPLYVVTLARQRWGMPDAACGLIGINDNAPGFPKPR